MTALRGVLSLPPRGLLSGVVRRQESEVVPMANNSFLCVADVETIYPNIGDPNYDSRIQTVAFDAYCVPLLWLALFRPIDMRTQTFTVEGGEVTVTAPITRKHIAFEQLARALPTLNRMFQKWGPLDDYAELLRTAVASASGKFVSIEMEEIAGLWTPDPADFYRQFSTALGRLELTRTRVTDRERLMCIAKLWEVKRFPPARCFLDKIEVSGEDCVTHCRLIGASWFRPVPWVPA